MYHLHQYWGSIFYFYSWLGLWSLFASIQIYDNFYILKCTEKGVRVRCIIASRESIEEECREYEQKENCYRVNLNLVLWADWNNSECISFNFSMPKQHCQLGICSAYLVPLFPSVFNLDLAFHAIAWPHRSLIDCIVQWEHSQESFLNSLFKSTFRELLDIQLKNWAGNSRCSAFSL